MNLEADAPIVENFVWSDDGFVDAPESLSPDGLNGHFGVHATEAGGVHRLYRDPLGVNKLFFSLAADGSVESSRFLIDLIRRGRPPETIWSVPSGHEIRIDSGQRLLSLRNYAQLDYAKAAPESDTELGRCADRIRTALEGTFTRLHDVTKGRRLYAALSGGVDSSVIATLARERLGEVVAVTFYIEGADEGPGTDLHYATRVATDLGMEHLVVPLSRSAVLESMDEVLIYGQDWRDFNVHCGLVTHALAAAIRRHHGDQARERPVVLTGDTLNELTADYSPVKYQGRDYYGLPRLTKGRMRRFLVSGLDSGDREVGIYAYHGVDTIQPHAMCARAYASIPASWLDSPNAKQAVLRRVMGERVPTYVYDRPKVRAQVGREDKVGGTMAAALDVGFDAARLQQRFLELFQIDEKYLQSLVRGGLYRFPTEYPRGSN